MKWAYLYENDYFESSIIWLFKTTYALQNQGNTLKAALFGYLKLHMPCRIRVIIVYFVAINGIDYKSYI